MPKCTFIFFCIYTVLYCFHWEHQQVEGVQSAHGGSLRFEGIGQIQNWYVILKEENIGFHLNMKNWPNSNVILKEDNLGFHLNINLSAIFEKLVILKEDEGIGQIQNW